MAPSAKRRGAEPRREPGHAKSGGDAKLADILRELILKYDPGQPRDPAGTSTGGQWTRAPGGMAQQTGTAPDGTPVEGAAGEDAAPIDLRQEEGGLHGGHTIRDHVGKSEDELISALLASRKEIWRGNVRATEQKEAVGSFHSLGDASYFVNSVIAENGREIDFHFGSSGKDSISITQRFGYITGVEAWSKNNDSEPVIRDTYEVRLVLRRSLLTQRGYRIVTAFPVNQKPSR